MFPLSVGGADAPLDLQGKGGLMQHRSPLGLLLIGMILTGCAQATAFSKGQSLPKPAPGVGVLLMQPDIELYELTTGGMLEPKADWTAMASDHVTAALREELQAKKAKLITYQPPSQNPSKQHAHVQLVKLHDVVGGSILFAGLLPTKKDRFEWSLGESVTILREDYGAGYALFILFRDSYASAGRKAMMVGAALFGVGVPAGRQVGFASLVDLGSGDLLWFNRLFDPAGDLRTAEAARKAVKNLLADLPL